MSALLESLHLVLDDQSGFLGILVSLSAGFKGFEVSSQGLLPLGQLFKFFPYYIFNVGASGHFCMELNHGINLPV